MLSGYKLLTAVGMLGLAGLLGCYSDRPHEYGKQRPPVDRIDPEDRGLQSKDVVAASDKMAMDILGGIPELNSSPHRWTVVVDRVENMTADSRQNLDIFLERVRVKLAQQGRGKVQLIENRAKLQELQSRELEPVGRGGDEYGQGGRSGQGGIPGGPGVQPDYALYGKIMEMPNRSTSYFLCEFTLSDLHSREQVWTNMYEVKVRN
jgi:hypothetical protein